MNKPFDYLVVGSGLFGATFAWKARRAGRRVLVVEKRPHTGGNIHCDFQEGIWVHRYGAHIFHTSDRKLWQFVNGLTPFNRYTNSPVANYKGELFNLPFNMNTFHQMWGVNTPAEARARLDTQRREALDMLKAAGCDTPRNLEEQALLLVGRDIYEKLVRGYTEKQWGRSATELPASIIRRLPVRFVFDNNYFNDAFQGIPENGYNALTDALLDGIEVRLGVDYLAHRDELDGLAGRTVYTGSLDAFYGYRFGHLHYRTVRFEDEVFDMPNFQGNAVVNYTERGVPYTRIIEHKHFAMFGDQVYAVPKTVVSKESSVEWKPGMEPYYPVNDPRNAALYEQYKALADREQRVIFGGRLAEYKYYDMAPVMLRALEAEV